MPDRDSGAGNSRRLRYIRYADDFLIGFTGLRAEAQAVKRHLHRFLMEKLKLELSEGKTLVTHARTEEAQFLGYAIKRMVENTKYKEGRRSVADALSLNVPIKAMKERLLRLNGPGRGSPRPQTGRYRQRRAGTEAQMDAGDGGAWAQDPNRLQSLPPGDPCGKTQN